MGINKHFSYGHCYIKKFNVANHQGNTNKTTMGYLLTPSTLLLKGQNIANICKHRQEREPLPSISGNGNKCRKLWKRYAGLQNK